MYCSTSGLPVPHHLPEFSQADVRWIGDAIQPFTFCCPLLLLPSIFSSIRVFPNEPALHIKWLKYWSFSFSINPSNECSGLTSFRIDWFDLLAVQGTLKSLLERHSSKASILWLSSFYILQLSHPYMTTGKTISLTVQIFVCSVLSPLFNTLSRFIIALLPASKHLWISWLWSPSAVIWEPKKMKSVTASVVYPPVCRDGTGSHVLSEPQEQYEKVH